MKAIMISIRPEWVEKILNKQKTIEIRKTMPKCDFPCKVYIYCTKGKKLYKSIECDDYFMYYSFEHWRDDDICVNGKVVAEFTLNKVEDFSNWEYDFGSLIRHLDLFAGTEGNYPILINYLNKQCKGFAWHIDNLKIYDKPKELREFKHFKKYDWWDYGHISNKPTYELESLDTPPQNWCYVEELGEI